MQNHNQGYAREVLNHIEETETESICEYFLKIITSGTQTKFIYRKWNVEKYIADTALENINLSTFVT